MNCTVGITGSNGSATVNDTATLQIDTTHVWNGTACVAPENGVCATGHYGCAKGTSINNAPSAGGWTWSCQGVNGGTTAACSEAVSASPVNGVCATNHYSCVSGTSINNVPNSSNWTWTCSGSGGGTSQNCSETNTTPATPVNGSCGTADAVTFPAGSTSYGSYTQCGPGTPSSTAFPAAGQTVTWTCAGSNGGASSPTCSATQSAPTTGVFDCSMWWNPTPISAYGNGPNQGYSTIFWKLTNAAGADFYANNQLQGSLAGGWPADNTTVGGWQEPSPSLQNPPGSGVTYSTNQQWAVRGYDNLGNGKTCYANLTVYNNALPTGFHDASSCDNIASGWACDANDYSQPLAVHVYRDGGPGVGTFVAAYSASANRPDVASSCGGFANHGFNGASASSLGLADGVAHTYYVYAIDIPGGGTNPLLGTSGKTLTCAPRSATISATPNPCSVAEGSNNCSTNVSWNITNAASPNVFSTFTNAVISNIQSGTNSVQTVAIGGTTFSARDSATTLASVTVTGQCGAGLAYSATSGVCLPCANGGCSSAGGGGCATPANPTCNLMCNNGALNPPTCSLPLPTATLSASRTMIVSGESSTLSWSSTNADSCTFVGGVAPVPGNPPSGSTPTGPLTATKTYQVLCTGGGGSKYSNTVTVTVLTPDAQVAATPTRVHTGQTSTIQWNSSNVTSCSITGPGLNNVSGTSGTRSVAVNAQSTYTLTCQTASGASLTRTVIVNIIPDFQEF